MSPLDPMKPASNLDATNVEMTAREKQNRFGQKHETVPDVGTAGFLSIIATTMPVKFSPEQWFEIKTYLETNYGITGLQALFEIDIPTPEPGCQNNLHITAHLRQDETPGGNTLKVE